MKLEKSTLETEHKILKKEHRKYKDKEGEIDPVPLIKDKYEKEKIQL